MWLVCGLSPRRSGFTPGSVHMGFVVDKVALRKAFLRVLLFSPVSIISPLLIIHLSPPHEVCDSPDQVAHYHNLGPKLGASSLTRLLAGTEERTIIFILFYIYLTSFGCGIRLVLRTKCDYFSPRIDFCVGNVMFLVDRPTFKIDLLLTLTSPFCHYLKLFGYISILYCSFTLFWIVTKITPKAPSL
jgi:hypothetical protein